MLRQQNVLLPLRFLGLFYQASGTLQLAMSDLLDMNLIRSLNKLRHSQHQLVEQEQ